MLYTGILLNNFTMKDAMDALNMELETNNKFIIRFKGNLIEVPEITMCNGDKVLYNDSYDGHRDKITEKLKNTNFTCYKIGVTNHTYALYQNTNPVTMKQFISEAIEANLLNDIVDLLTDKTRIVKIIQ